MEYTILKGTHYALPLQVRMPRRLNMNGGMVTAEMTTTFELSSAYDLHDSDQQDWNKLGGFCFGLTGIHENSFRFGWRYNTDSHMIELAAYEYANGERTMQHIGDVALGQRARLGIAVHSTRSGRIDVRYMVNENSLRNYPIYLYRYVGKESAWLWYSGLYFGGNRKAPHTIKIDNQIKIK